MMFHNSINSGVLILNIDDQVWQHLNLFQSATTTQLFLKKCYQEVGITEGEKRSYDNCYSFMYYLEQGELYYKQAYLAPLSIKPVLLFYGLVHLLKACVLTVDSTYPSSTSILAHGVSTRKRKKQNYLFYQDEVKIQRLGLCTHFAERMFHVKQIEGEKIMMGDLLELVAELDDTFLFLKGMPSMILLEEESDRYLRIPKNVEQLYYMSAERLKKHLKDKHFGEICWKVEIGEELLLNPKESNLLTPFRFHLIKQRICLPSKLHTHNSLPDLLIHYLLLYNLSMIARYETEWWLDLMKTASNTDYPFIKTFLAITEKKGPYLILEFLSKKLEGFHNKKK